MQATDATYNALLAAGAPKAARAIIDGVVYGMDKIVSATVKASLMSTAATVGNCVAKELHLVIRDPGNIPRMARIQMQFRLVGTPSSSWMPKGVYFIDTREETADGVLSITAYDQMLRLDQPYMKSGNQGGWPKKDWEVLSVIRRALTASYDMLPLDSRTAEIISSPGLYDVGYPGYGDGAYTMRDVLGFIGSMYGGNWIITDRNELRLVALGDIPPDTTNLLITEDGDYLTIGGYRIIVS